MKRTRLVALFLAAIMMLAVMAGCSGGGETIKVGLIAPLTGNVAVYGNAVKDAVELYVKQFNEDGGVNGKQIELIVYDDKGDATEAMNAYNKLVSSDGVCSIIGPVTSTPTFGVAEASAADGIPCITGTATHPDVTTYGNNFFRACFEDPFQGGAIATFASDYLEAKTAAIIYNTADSYSTGLMNPITAKANELGLEIVATEGYGKDDVDFRSQLTNILDKAPDVLFIPDYYNTAYLICSQARELGLESTFLGVDGTDGVLDIEGADLTVFDGMYFANHYSADDTAEAVQKFISDYKAVYDATPNALAALGYDATMILMQAIKSVDASGVKVSNTKESYDAIINAISATDMDCVTGHITFDENGNPIKECTIIGIQDAAYFFVAKY